VSVVGYRCFACLLLCSAACQIDSAALEIRSVTPDRVPSSRATTITIDGQGIRAFASVDLDGNKPARIENSWTVQLDEVALTPDAIQSSGSLQATVPANLPVGSYDVFLSSPSGEDALLRDGLTIVDDSGLLLSIENAPGGSGQAQSDSILALGESADFFAIGRSQDNSFLFDVEGDWSLDNSVGVLSQAQGTSTTFTSSELGTNVLRVTTQDYGSASSNLTVLDSPATPYLNLFFNNVGIDENLLRFPVLVTLTPANFNYGLADPLGADLVFIDDDDTTVLPHQIEEWNVGGVSQIWVAVPQINADSSTDHIHLRYGDLSAAPGEDPAGVWSLYHAVYHLAENATGAANEIKDSSSPTHHGRGGSGLASPATAAGKIGQGQLFDGASDEIIVDPSDTFLFPSNSISISYWASYPATGTERAAVSKGNGAQGYGSGISSAGQLSWFLSGSLLFSISVPAPNVFHHFVNTWDGSTMSSYVDGVLVAEVPKAGAFATTLDPFYIGRAPSGIFFLGIIDEVRVLDSALSGAWIAAQYRSMQNNYITYVEGT
jgi:hypothetical protein